MKSNKHTCDFYFLSTDWVVVGVAKNVSAGQWDNYQGKAKIYDSTAHLRVCVVEQMRDGDHHVIVVVGDSTGAQAGYEESIRKL